MKKLLIASLVLCSTVSFAANGMKVDKPMKITKNVFCRQVRQMILAEDANGNEIVAYVKVWKRCS